MAGQAWRTPRLTVAVALITCLFIHRVAVCQGRRALLQVLGRAAEMERDVSSTVNPSVQDNESEGQKTQGLEDNAEAEVAKSESNADATSVDAIQAENETASVNGVDAETDPELWPRIHCKSANLSELAADLSDLHLMFRQGDIHKLHEYPIPRFIHQTSKGTRPEYNPEPPMGKWPEKHQGYTHIVWSDASAEHFLETCIPDILPLFKAAPAGILRSDMLRYLVLLVFGGIWGDEDTEPLRSFDDWLNGVEGESMHARIRLITGVENDSPEWQSSGFGSPVQLVQWTFAAAPGHPVLWYTVQQVAANIAKLIRELFFTASEEFGDSTSGDQDESQSLWKSSPKVPIVLPEPGSSKNRNVTRRDVLGTTGPWLWTKSVNWKMKQGGWGMEDMQNLTAGKTFGDMVVLPITAFSPGHGSGSKPETDPEARVKHHFHGSWLQEVPQF